MKIKATGIFRLFTVAVLLAVGASVVPVSALADGNVFTDPGKFSVWEVVGPNGGDVRVVAIDPRDKDRLYISTMDGQIHTSADGGKSWKLLATLEQPQLILDQLFVDSRDSKVLYTSGHRGKMAGGFFKSTDGGIKWKEAKDPCHDAGVGQPGHAVCRYDQRCLDVEEFG